MAIMVLTESTANLLADSFAAKCVLPPESFRVHIDAPEVHLSDFTLIRTRWTLAALRAINDDKATGPDCIPGRVLRECALEVASPLTRLSCPLTSLARTMALALGCTFVEKRHPVATSKLSWSPFDGYHLKNCRAGRRTGAGHIFGFDKRVWLVSVGFPSSAQLPRTHHLVGLHMVVVDELWSESRRLFERYFCCF